MNRRDAIKTLTLAIGGTLASSRATLAQETPRPDRTSLSLTDRDVAMLDEFGETVIPTTPDSPGAKASRIGEYIKEIVETQYSDTDRKAFLMGIDAIDTLSRRRFGGDFLQISPNQRFQLLISLEKNFLAFYYPKMRDLVVSGYFSSEVGATQALDNLPIPGRWDPCIDVDFDKKPWS